MSEIYNPIPPIFGYIAQPRVDPVTGQTVYVAIGEPVLIPNITPQGQTIYVYQTPPNEMPRKKQNGNIIDGAINFLSETISETSREISREIKQAWNSALF